MTDKERIGINETILGKSLEEKFLFYWIGKAIFYTKEDFLENEGVHLTEDDDPNVAFSSEELKEFWETVNFVDSFKKSHIERKEKKIALKQTVLANSLEEPGFEFYFYAGRAFCLDEEGFLKSHDLTILPFNKPKKYNEFWFVMNS